MIKIFLKKQLIINCLSGHRVISSNAMSNLLVQHEEDTQTFFIALANNGNDREHIVMFTNLLLNYIYSKKNLAATSFHGISRLW